MSGLSGFILISLGFAAGLACYHWLIQTRISPDPQKNRVLNQQIDQLHQEYAEYQNNADAHFNRSQELLFDLKNSFNAIHDHFTQRNQIAEQNSDALIPPKDYAPKKAADEQGTLAESFGLKSFDLKEKP